MLTTRKIVYTVNEMLHEIEQQLHQRIAEEVFTRGNCGLMPSFYRKTGLENVVPIAAGSFAHIYSKIDNGFYDIDGSCTYLFRGLSRLKPASKRQVEEYSYNFGINHYGENDRKPEKKRMLLTRAELLKQLEKFKMLGLKKDTKSGLYYQTSGNL